MKDLFQKGQKVIYKNNDFDAVKKIVPCVVKEIYSDHMIITDIETGIDLWIEEGFNRDLLFPDYTDIFNKKWNRCLQEAENDLKENDSNTDVTYVATELFEETANAEEVVGYYIVYHGESALKDWTNNTKGIRFTKQDKEVDKILKELYR